MATEACLENAQEKELQLNRFLSDFEFPGLSM